MLATWVADNLRKINKKITDAKISTTNYRPPRLASSLCLHIFGEERLKSDFLVFLVEKFCGIKKNIYLCLAVEKNSKRIAQVVELVDTLL